VSALGVEYTTPVVAVVLKSPVTLGVYTHVSLLGGSRSTRRFFGFKIFVRFVLTIVGVSDSCVKTIAYAA